MKGLFYIGMIGLPDSGKSLTLYFVDEMGAIMDETIVFLVEGIRL